jgi:F0F1-type ATP synthase membrane subunit b/b'
MLGFIYSFTLFLAEAGGHGGGGFTEFYNTYLNYPGFEAWKFINLAIFVLILVYLLKKPLGEAFKAKREAIRADLIRAEEEKQAALARLTEVEAKLVSLENEKAEVIRKAQSEVEAEKVRLAKETEEEINRLRHQAEAELARLSSQLKADLKRFSADESIRLAEEKLRSKISAENDARLVQTGIAAIGGVK